MKSDVKRKRGTDGGVNLAPGRVESVVIREKYKRQGKEEGDRGE